MKLKSHKSADVIGSDVYGSTAGFIVSLFMSFIATKFLQGQ